MKVEYAPEAHETIARLGPAMLELPFGAPGSAVSLACESSIVGVATFSDAQYAFIALALTMSNGRTAAIHLNLTSAYARKVGAALIENANRMDAAAGVPKAGVN